MLRIRLTTAVAAALLGAACKGGPPVRSDHLPTTLEVQGEASLELPTTLEVQGEASLELLGCPLGARPELPGSPDVGTVLALARRVNDRCLESCPEEDTLPARIVVDPSGAVAGIFLSEPESACTAKPEVLECVAATLDGLCFEPSRDGTTINYVVRKRPEEARGQAVPIYLGHGPIPLMRHAPRSYGEEGSATVGFDIDPEGRVQDVRVLQSTGLGDRSKRSARKAMQRWRFIPAADPEGQTMWARDQKMRLVFRVVK